jgi:prepilin-type N-terminal cleavage/methylation domain-containing protein
MKNIRRFARPLVRARRGYTVVEVMMALAVMTVGGMGVVALQKFTAVGSLNSRSMTSASDVANSWVEFLQGEATTWNRADNSDIVDAKLLNTALSSPGNWISIPTNAGWGLPTGGATQVFGDTTNTVAFCSQIRATWLVAKDAAAAQTGPALTIAAKPTDVVRVEVRTWYSKTGRAINNECANWTAAGVTNLLATPNGYLSDGTTNRSRFEFGWVYAAGTVRRNTLL